MSRKIKILYTIPNFDTAGSQRVVYDLVQGLDKSKFDISIACDSNKGAFFKEVAALGVPIHIIPTTVAYRPYWNLLTRMNPVIRFFKQHKFDIIHSWHWSSDWTEVLAAKRSGAIWLFTKKAMSWGNRHWKIRSYLSDFIITINNEMRNFFPKKRQQALIPLGIDVGYYNNEHFPKKPNTTDFTIVTVANLVPVKGIEVLLKAIKLLNNTNVKLNIVGDNDTPYGTQLRIICEELLLSKQVTFVGKVADVRPYIAAANTYVIPTLDQGRKEGMPMALVEAMCMAVPTVGSDISGINFVLKNFPELLFEAGNEHQLASTLENLVQQTTAKRNETGASLRAYCLENFSMETFINAHEHLYLQLCNKRNR